MDFLILESHHCENNFYISIPINFLDIIMNNGHPHGVIQLVE